MEEFLRENGSRGFKRETDSVLRKMESFFKDFGKTGEEFIGFRRRMKI